MPQPRRFSPRVALFTLLVGWLGLALAADADWLITHEGRLIETQGAWKIEAGTLTYTDTAGDEQKLALSKVNLEQSEKLTALKAAKPYVPKLAPKDEDPALTPAPRGTGTPAPEAATSEPQVVLYMTSWCGYCRRTSQLLETLGVDYVEKDIEKDPAATEAYRKITGGGGGVPVLDIGGNIVRGFKPTLIHSLVQRLKAQQPAAAAPPAAEEGPSS